MPESPRSSPLSSAAAAAGAAGGRPAGRRRPDGAAGARDLLRICGLAAVRARFARDPDSIERLYFDAETGRKIGIICRQLAARKKIYRSVPPEELGKIAGSIHHGGIVAVVAPPACPVPAAADAARWARERQAVLVLDRIGNAHNLGALARTAAFFGVDHLVLADAPGAARAGDAAYRTAEGGLEELSLWQSPRIEVVVRDLRAAGYSVLGAAATGGPPPGARGGRDGLRALVLGNEEHGLAPEVASACTGLVTIPGRGRVQSLNVSVAGAILLWEFLAGS